MSSKDAGSIAYKDCVLAESGMDCLYYETFWPSTYNVQYILTHSTLFRESFDFSGLPP
jgi:hypothetical protein